MINTLAGISVAQLKKAVTIKERIQKLERKLAAVIGASDSVPTERKARKKWTMSPEARAKIAAAQRARWAKQKGKKK